MSDVIVLSKRMKKSLSRTMSAASNEITSGQCNFVKLVIRVFKDLPAVAYLCFDAEEWSFYSAR